MIKLFMQEIYIAARNALFIKRTVKGGKSDPSGVPIDPPCCYWDDDDEIYEGMYENEQDF